MPKIWLCIFLMLSFGKLRAQDSLFVQSKSGKAYIAHKVRSGETLFMLAKRYAVPPAVLADDNGKTYQDGLEPGTSLFIPVADYNYIRTESVVNSKPIYYKATPNDGLRNISRLVNVAQSALQRWNHLDEQKINSNQTLLIGWVAFDKTQVPFPIKKIDTAKGALGGLKQKVNIKPTPLQAKDTARIKKTAINTSMPTDSTVSDPPSAYQLAFEKNTDGMNLQEESGAAVFYNIKVKAGPGLYFALHNTIPKGSYVKVTNPANGNIIYAKVIGTIPNLKDYTNCILALSSNAAKGLLAKERRVFCKINYR